MGEVLEFFIWAQVFTYNIQLVCDYCKGGNGYRCWFNEWMNVRII